MRGGQAERHLPTEMPTWYRELSDITCLFLPWKRSWGTSRPFSLQHARPPLHSTFGHPAGPAAPGTQDSQLQGVPGPIAQLPAPQLQFQASFEAPSPRKLPTALEAATSLSATAFAVTQRRTQGLRGRLGQQIHTGPEIWRMHSGFIQRGCKAASSQHPRHVLFDWSCFSRSCLERKFNSFPN